MYRLLLVAALVFPLLVLAPSTAAQVDQRCFPETNQCISGRIRTFWEQNGGLPIFGFPIAPQTTELVEGRLYEAQWFERSRLELHPENPPPYDVLLGRLGAEVVAQQQAPTPPPTPVGLPGIPTPTGDCVANVPPGAEGAQAWMTVPQPATINQFDSICGRLIVNGAVVSGAQMNAVAHYHNKAVSFGPVRTGADGVAEIGFKIGDEHLALRRLEVTVDVTITTPDQKKYTAQTSFTPVYPKPTP